MAARYAFLGCFALGIACGSPHVGADSGTADSSADGELGCWGAGCDARATCPSGGNSQCSDCIDNDQDGTIDGFDPECAGAFDNREDSFSLGLADGDAMGEQDCFFDANGGAGNDGCVQHPCCLLQAPNVGSCPVDASSYSKSGCYQPFGPVPVPQKCLTVCAPLTPPGCDCFGCCTECTALGCRDVSINGYLSPNCDQDNLDDPGPDGQDATGDEPCKPCVKSACGNTECGGTPCSLCSGQPLPASCTEVTCPNSIAPCAADGNCPANHYCSNGCCIDVLI